MGTSLGPAQSAEPTAKTALATREATEHKFPSLYQINTRVYLNELWIALGSKATFDSISDGELDRLASEGFNWLWFLGVWQTGLAGQKVSRDKPEWQAEFLTALPELQRDDVCGSCFAITKYEVHSDFGGDAALQRLRDRLNKRGMRLLLDFVPNHTALDHGWVQEHPEYYIQGTDEQLLDQPQNYVRLDIGSETRVFAYGRDPYFDGWPDTLQLNYAEPALQDAMREQLQNVAAKCDGVRCDMAMLILPDVFERTWGLRIKPFWPRSIESVRSKWQRFLLMAEVYWDLEWTLQQQGFNYTYDKRLYDRLRQGHAGPVRDHFRADKEFQQKSVRFLENHDEPRAAAAFPQGTHEAAAVVTYLCQGLRFFHDGQFAGLTHKLSVHVGRRPIEAATSRLNDFYARLLECTHLPQTQDGDWQLLNCAVAWDGNWTSDCFICFAWQKAKCPTLLVAVNYAPNRSQCYVQLPFKELRGHAVQARDLMSSVAYERDGDELFNRGLYLDMPEWGYHIFELGSL